MSCYNKLMHFTFDYENIDGEVFQVEYDNVRRTRTYNDFILLVMEGCENHSVFFNTPSQCVTHITSFPQSEWGVPETEDDEGEPETVSVSIPVSSLPPRDEFGRFMKIH